ncbi:Ldh family oxidoreductase [Halomonas sp. HP20-15]|uniref:Ldh family oxidoreductase n=1 Tax=Halomonas sp. HP20-15 TaxID=3085901 RepID=UPI002981A9DF|nr:Ldh family oxidoreductase [Halomonas sp. HP20-15]MDW5375773.1 Ldh family oxidoreductase [Halomonas sp. HP20-15]
MAEELTLSLTDAEALSRQVLLNNGFNPAHAAAITRSVVAAQRDECHSHGLYRLIGCAQTAQYRGIDPHAEPAVIDQAPSVVRVDANRGSSLLAFERGLPLLVEKAQRNGIAVLGINNSFHFSALWQEVEALSDQGLAGIAMTPSHAYVAPAGGKSPLFGTNPFAFSWPRPGKTPYTFDFATSVVARGEIELHKRAGESLPEGWAIDREGNPTSDPQAALDGALLPFGGYKGSALSSMIELLAGPLIGDLLGHETQPATPDGQGKPFHGELIIAFSLETFLGDDKERQQRHAEALFDAIVDQGARLPSQRRFAARERSRAAGVTIPWALYDELKALATPA